MFFGGLISRALGGTGAREVSFIRRPNPGASIEEEVDMTEGNTKVMTLLAEKGKKWEETQECIASHEGSIVFLPRDVRAGDVVRVKLLPIEGKIDARGKVMYRAAHSPIPLDADTLRWISTEAKLLRSCQVYDRATAMTLLRAQYGVTMPAWEKFQHYYFEESGWVFGTNLSSATLFVLEQLSSLPATAWTEPLLWLIDNQFRTLREQGKELSWQTMIPQISDEWVGRVVAKAVAQEQVISTALVSVEKGKVKIPALLDALWAKAQWPTLPLPAVLDGGDWPELMTHQYGIDPNGEKLVGYGVCVLKDVVPFADWTWHRNATEAETAQAVARTQYAEWQRDVMTKRTEVISAFERLRDRRSTVGLATPASLGLWYYEFSNFQSRRSFKETSAEQVEMETVEAEERIKRLAERERRIAEETALAKALADAKAKADIEAAEHQASERSEQLRLAKARLQRLNERRKRVGWEPITSNGEYLLVAKSWQDALESITFESLEQEVQQEEKRLENERQTAEQAASQAIASPDMLRRLLGERFKVK